MALTKRVEILFDECDYKALEDEASRRKQSVGAVVRATVAEHVTGPSQRQRLEALERMLARRGPVGSPEEINQAITEAKLKGLVDHDEAD